MQVTRAFDANAPLAAPRWLDGARRFCGCAALVALAVVIDVRYIVPATASSAPAGWACLPVLEPAAPTDAAMPRLFVASGSYQLPLFRGLPAPALLAEMRRSRDVDATLAAALAVRGPSRTPPDTRGPAFWRCAAKRRVNAAPQLAVSHRRCASR